MANGISFSGLGSGLDTASIIQQLVALERLPIQALEGQKKGVQDRISTLGTLKGLVKSLQTKAKELAARRDFLEFDVTPSQEGVATFSASGSAVAGSHTLTVLRLASVDRWAFDGVASPTTDLATGAGQQISFDVNGTNYSVTLQQDQSSLEEIAVAINDLADADVEASVVNTGTGTSPSWKLVLTAAESGEDYRISNIASTVAGLSIQWSAPDAEGGPTSADNVTVGNNALAQIDGLTVERTTNEFNDVVTGVSITTTSSDPDNTIQFTVEADQTAIKKKLKEFVDAYNEVVKFANTQNTYTEDVGPAGKLFGDPILSTVRSRIDSALFGVDIADVTADTLGFSTLNLVGIERQNDGTLLIDDTTLSEKLAEDIDAFSDLFIDADGFDNGGADVSSPAYFVDTSVDSGLAASLDRAIERMFDSIDGPNGEVVKGLFDARNETWNSDLRRFDRQIESKENYLERFEEGLIQRFARLEELIGGLNAQGASLMAALGG